MTPDLGKPEWEAVGRILLKGFVDTGVYPLQLSFAFSVAVIFGESNVNADMLYESLRMYLSESDRRVVDTVLAGGELDRDDRDDFLDLLSRVNAHAVPSDEELKPTILSVAHKELIQEPKYALDAIANVATESLKSFLPTPESLSEMYSNKKPTARKVIKLLECNPMSKDEASVFSYFKQFVKGLNGMLLRKLLLFVTGAEIICTPSIEITFSCTTGAGRVPEAHTCGPLLVLPSTYRSYPEFRAEFMNILESNYLNMDIV